VSPDSPDSKEWETFMDDFQQTLARRYPPPNRQS
jgi:hypothetical protein